MQRRTFLRLGLGGAAAVGGLVPFRRDPAHAQVAPGPFGHGVASGDPLPDGIVLWTRVTPTPEAVPGSGLGAPTEVAVEIATDDAFASVVATASVLSDPDRDHCVTLDVRGLAAATEHHYRFVALGSTSPVGRFRTAPAHDAEVRQLRFGVVSCSNWEGGYFSAYRHLADRDDLDAVLHLGDYLYEYGAGGYGPGASFGRVHDPAHEMVALDDYRRRHALYKTDPDLAALHRRYAFIATIDDHEVADNSWSDGAVNHDPATEGAYDDRRAAALQAYFEWMPVRVTGAPGEPTRVWRRLGFGDLADLVLLDERTHRSPQPEGLSGDIFVTSAEPDDPGRTMLGAEQLDFLTDELQQSTARWKLVGNGVMFAPLVLLDAPDVVTDLVPTLVPQVGVPVVLNGDQWDGYRVEQRAVGALFGEVGGVVVLTGDIHSSWAAEIPADTATYLPGVGGPTTAVEFVVPAVTSDSFSATIEGLGVPNAAALATVLPDVVKTAGPWFKYLDPDRHGFGVLDVTDAQVQFDWHVVSDRTDPAATAAFAAAWASPAGSNRLVPATELAARADRGPAGSPRTPVGAAPAAAGSTALPATGGVPALPAAGALAALAAAGLALRHRAAGGTTGAGGPT